MSEQAPSKEKVADRILSEAIDCCRSWEPEVRLIGNVRAIDLRDLLLELWKHRNVPASAHEPPDERPSPMIDGIDSAMALQMADSADITGVDTQHAKALIVLARAHRGLRERFAKACGEVTRLSQPPVPEHSDLELAAIRYVQCAITHPGSEHFQHNGLHGMSPWNELCAAVGDTCSSATKSGEQ